MTAKKVWAIALCVIVVLGMAGIGVYKLNSSMSAKEITAAEAESFVNKAFDEIAVSNTAKAIAKENKITVEDMYYGDEKNIVLTCRVSTIDVHGAVSPLYNEFMVTDVKKKNGTMFKSALDFKLEFEEKILSLISGKEKKEMPLEIEIFQDGDNFVAYTSRDAVNTIYGGVADIEDEVMSITTYTDKEGKEQKIQSTNVNKGLVECFELRYNKQKPDVSSATGKALNKLKADFHKNFIEHGRWKTIFKGLWVTIKLTFFSLLIGVVLGFLVAFVRCTYLKNTKRGILLKLFNSICQIYLTVIRGTPAVVQITIIYFVIFMPLGVDKFLSAVVCFGVNSGAYVAEIVRGGIMSVDDGQTEAGRSLGFGYMPTMFYIVFPQAFKAVLPALANEFVVLLKETSIAFYIGLGDIMYSVNAIRAATYTPFMPLLAAALIYLVMVIVLSKLVSLLERRMRNNER